MMKIIIFSLFFTFSVSLASDCSHSIQWSSNWKFNIKKLKTTKFSESEIIDQLKQIILSGLNKIDSHSKCKISQRIQPYYDKELIITTKDLSKKKYDGLHYEKYFTKKEFLDIDVYFESKNHIFNSNLSKNIILHEFLHFLDLDNQKRKHHKKINGYDSEGVRNFAYNDDKTYYQDEIIIKANEVDAIYACSYFIYPFMPFTNFSSYKPELKRAYKRACAFCLKSIAKDNFAKQSCHNSNLEITPETFMFH